MQLLKDSAVNLVSSALSFSCIYGLLGWYNLLFVKNRYSLTAFCLELALLSLAVLFVSRSNSTVKLRQLVLLVVMALGLGAISVAIQNISNGVGTFFNALVVSTFSLTWLYVVLVYTMHNLYFAFWQRPT